MSKKDITLVFIHYFGGNENSWKWLAKRLVMKYDCIFLTIPGFGNTQPLSEPSIRNMSEWISGKIDSLNLKRYILVGHSMGGKLALFTAFVNYDALPEKNYLNCSIATNYGANG